MWNHILPTFTIGIIMVAGVTLSACDGPTSTIEPDTVSEVNNEQSPNKESVQTPPADLDGATVEQGVPVKYDVSAWGEDNIDPISLDDVDKIKATFGDVLSTDENSLDYASNPATKYRFMDTDAPYLDIVDSSKYLELGWYYANPSDSDKEKDISRNHAKKAYTLARQLMGDEGSKVMADMLAGQIIKNKTVNGQKIELAKCEFYSCMLIVNKSASEASVIAPNDSK